ncbi:ParB/RepB/Spo0J family partition protein [Halotia branconii]|uniref:ParB/RepB/Spo0J family partition protein n=1 Tax=Halotia branconii CENA392 TaxID=1539056 RepID=A0AAJ6NZ00_9CYAN|nr:ParB/RepB/Spo0J family partition protein [Halotia branconii]WGV29079.1 ParB/RepB/Spo0J family partition protein [Halotia branconii CENA392]
MMEKSKSKEMFQFGGVLDAFVTAQAEATSDATQLLLIENIVLPQNQPRRYFDPNKHEQLKLSIKQHGILQPLIVRPLANDRYELVAGERRYRAALELKLEKVPIVVLHLNDKEVIQVALVENLQREDLNPVEETEAVVQLLALQLNMPVQEVPALLFRMQKEAKGKTAHNVVGQSEVQVIQEVFNSLGLMSWESFTTHRLPLRNLPKEILEVLSQGKIAYTKAQAIARIKNKNERQAILEDVISNNLSLNQIKERILNLNSNTTGSEIEENIAYQDRLKAISIKAKRAKAWDNPKKKQKLDKLLSELEKLFTED